MTERISQEHFIIEYFDNKENIHRARMLSRFTKMFKCLKDEARSGDFETDLGKLADKSIETLYEECLSSLDDLEFRTIEKDDELEETIVIEKDFNQLNSDIL